MFENRLHLRISAATPRGKNRYSAVGLIAFAKPQDDLVLELPQHLDLMAARLQNGEDIYQVLTEQARAAGRFSRALRSLAIRLKLGETLDNSLASLAEECDSPLVTELVNKLTLGLTRGTPLAAQFHLLSASSKGQLKVMQLKAAGRNELLMLIPLVFMILPVTIAFAVFPSLQLLQLGV